MESKGIHAVKLTIPPKCQHCEWTIGFVRLWANDGLAPKIVGKYTLQRGVSPEYNEERRIYLVELEKNTKME